MHPSSTSRRLSLTERMAALAAARTASSCSTEPSSDKFLLSSLTLGVTSLLAPAFPNGQADKMEDEFQPFRHFGTQAIHAGNVPERWSKCNNNLIYYTQQNLMLHGQSFDCCIAHLSHYWRVVQFCTNVATAANQNLACAGLNFVRVYFCCRSADPITWLMGRKLSVR